MTCNVIFLYFDKNKLMTRQEFIDAVVIASATEWGGALNVRLDWAEALADERAKRCPFDEEELETVPLSEVFTDPYAVNWDDAPIWANWHAVDEDGEGWWYELEPAVQKNEWLVEGITFGEGKRSVFTGFNPNWKESLRERPSNETVTNRPERGEK